jgi:hypothetical protein
MTGRCYRHIVAPVTLSEKLYEVFHVEKFVLSCFFCSDDIDLTDDINGVVNMKGRMEISLTCTPGKGGSLGMSSFLLQCRLAALNTSSHA